MGSAKPNLIRPVEKKQQAKSTKPIKLTKQYKQLVRPVGEKNNNLKQAKTTKSTIRTVTNKLVRPACDINYLSLSMYIMCVCIYIYIDVYTHYIYVYIYIYIHSCTLI